MVEHEVKNRSAQNAMYYQNNKEKAYKKYWEGGGREKAALRYRNLLKTAPVKNAEEVVEVVKTIQKYVPEIVLSFD